MERNWRMCFFSRFLFKAFRSLAGEKIRWGEYQAAPCHSLEREIYASIHTCFADKDHWKKRRQTAWSYPASTIRVRTLGTKIRTLLLTESDISHEVSEKIQEVVDQSRAGNRVHSIQVFFLLMGYSHFSDKAAPIIPTIIIRAPMQGSDRVLEGCTFTPLHTAGL